MLSTNPAQLSAQSAKSLVKRLQENPTAPVIINVSELLNSQGKHDKALKHLTAVQNIYSQSYRYNLVLARTYRRLKDYPNAKRHYDIACSLAPQNEIALRELAELFSEEFQNQLSVPLTAAAITTDLGKDSDMPSQQAESETEPEAQVSDLFVDEPKNLLDLDQHEENELFVEETPETEISEPEQTADALFAEQPEITPEQEESGDLSADDVFINQDELEVEEQAGSLEDVDTDDSEPENEELEADVLFSDEPTEIIADPDQVFEVTDEHTPSEEVQNETGSNLFVEDPGIEAPEENIESLFTEDSSKELIESEAEPADSTQETVPPDSEDVLTENPAETNQPVEPQEESDIHLQPDNDEPVKEDSQVDDLFESDTQSQTQAEFSEPSDETESNATQADTSDLFASDTPQAETAQEEPASTSSIFEPDDSPSSYDPTEINDLFIPDDESFGLDKVGDISNAHDLLPTTINAEQLQREAIRLLEEEQGPIGFDPLQDFDAPQEEQEPNPSPKDELEDLPAISAQDNTTTDTPSAEGLFEDASTEQPDSDSESQQSASDLFMEDSPMTGYEMPTESQSEESDFIPPPLPDDTLKEEFSETESSSKSQGYDLDYDDDFEFKIDKKKLAQALSNLGDSENDDTPENAQNEHQNSDSIEDIASSLSEASFKPMHETEDPTPVNEQRQPFSDDEAIKTPTLSLAKIFYSQGAYTKAINIYRALIQKDPDNITDYEQAIEDIQQKMSEEQ